MVSKIVQKCISDSMPKRAFSIWAAQSSILRHLAYSQRGSPIIDAPDGA
ncbi:hypothetical protein C7S13_3035 [Burkholderia cepacia]|nr:hypothetical protein [Burkholderia cepacia]